MQYVWGTADINSITLGFFRLTVIGLEKAIFFLECVQSINISLSILNSPNYCPYFP